MNAVGDRSRILKQLHRLWMAAIGIAIASFVLGMLWVISPDGPGFDWIWCVAAFGVAAVVYNAALFALCSVFTPGLSELVEDDTEIHGDDVVHVVRHQETGDEELDAFIRSYANARAATAVAIVSGIMITLALVFF